MCYTLRMFPSEIIYFGAGLQFIGIVFYLRSIYKDVAKPNLVSWLIWALAPLIGTYFLVKAGAGLSALPVFMAGFGPFLVIIFATYRGNAFWKLRAFDLYCGVLSLLALIIYILTRNLGISIFFAIMSDFLACVPTVLKSWHFPETESPLIYFFALVSNSLGLLALKYWSFSTAAFSIFMILQCVVILFSIYHKRIFPISETKV